MDGLKTLRLQGDQFFYGKMGGFAGVRGSGKSPRFSAGYQKADDCTVSLKRIEFALERVKLRGKAE